jgi:hypothetical protein
MSRPSVSVGLVYVVTSRRTFWVAGYGDVLVFPKVVSALLSVFYDGATCFAEIDGLLCDVGSHGLIDESGDGREVGVGLKQRSVWEGLARWRGTALRFYVLFSTIS